MATTETIVLHGIEGFARKSGTDQHGCQWVQYELDWGTCPDGPDECCICGAEIESGWLCLDGGDVCCDEHVEYAPGGNA
jgi:hypothetical protein